MVGFLFGSKLLCCRSRTNDAGDIACTTLGLPMDIFEFDISPTGKVEKRDMGTCAFESGMTEGIVIKPGERPLGPHSFGGGLTVKQGR